MCGILGCYVNKMDDRVLKILYTLFYNQKSRGQQGGGVSISNGKARIRFRTTNPFRLFNIYNRKLWSKLIEGRSCLIHHRFPTSTPNKLRFNHPIATEDGSIHMIHNGMVWGCDDVYKRLKHTHKFETYDKKQKRDKFTDSEIILHEFEDAYAETQDVVKAFEQVYKNVNGCFAIAMHIKDIDGIVLFRYNNPIVISEDRDGNTYFSSELHKTKHVRLKQELENGEVGVINQDGYQKLGIIETEVFKWKRKGQQKWYEHYPYLPMTPSKW